MRPPPTLFQNFLFLILLWVPLSSQTILTTSSHIRLTLLRVDSQDYPEIHLHLKLESLSREKLLPWTPRQISLFEEGFNLPAQIHTFYQPKRVSLLVLDTSASMNALLPNHQKTRIQAAKDAARTFFSLMEPQDRSALMTFSEEIHFRQLFTSKSEILQKALDSLVPEGSTALYQAISKAIEELQGTTGNKILLVLTDGKNTELAPAIDHIIALAQKHKIRIFLVGLAQEQELDFSVLQKIATETGGFAYHTLNQEKLATIYRSIAVSFKQEYLLSYRSTLPALGHQRTVRLVFQNGNQLFSGELPLVFGGLIPTTSSRSIELTLQSQKPHSIFFHYTCYLFLCAIIPWGLRKLFLLFLRKRFEHRYLLHLTKHHPAIGQVCANEQNEETAFQLESEVILCPECKALHHRDCWAYNGFRCFNAPLCRGHGGG